MRRMPSSSRATTSCSPNNRAVRTTRGVPWGAFVLGQESSEHTRAKARREQITSATSFYVKGSRTGQRRNNLLSQVVWVYAVLEASQFSRLKTWKPGEPGSWVGFFGTTLAVTATLCAV